MYYRLNGLTVQLPALRERTDFAALTAQLLADLATEQGLPHPVQVAPDLLQRLAAHPWPGNLRQYASVLRTACAMLAEGEDTWAGNTWRRHRAGAANGGKPAPCLTRLAGLTTPGRCLRQRCSACKSSPAPPSTRRCKARGNVRRRHASWASAARRCTASWLRGCIDLLLNA